MISSTYLSSNIEMFRTMCLSLYPGDIDTLSREDRTLQFSGRSDRNDSYSQYLGLNITHPIDHICQLVKTPRLLKHILRHCLSSWELLHGEVDFDDLLIVNVLKFATPEAFAFTLNYSTELRSLLNDTMEKDREKRQAGIVSRWSEVTTHVTWDAPSARSLVQFLFYGWNSKSVTIRKKAPLQGVQNASQTDYWERVIAGELDEKASRDQDILHALQEWKNDPNSRQHYRGNALATILAKDDFISQQVEYFSPVLLNGHDYRSLASQLFKFGLAEYGVLSNKDSMPGFILLWKLAIRAPIDQAEHRIWVEQEICKALPISLSFANDIYYYWRSNSEFDTRFDLNHLELRKVVVSHARQLFSSSPALLISVVDPHYLYSFYRFCVFFSSEEQGGPGFNREEWKWFSELLVTAAKVNPEIIVPQIAGLFVGEDLGADGFSYSFKEDFAAEFFGDHIEDIMSMLSLDISLDGLDDRDINYIKLVRDKAVAWLAGNCNKPKPAIKTILSVAGETHPLNHR